MARDIEEFLRKAAERRKQQQAGKQGAASPQPARQQPPRQPPRRKPQPNIIQAVEVIDDEIIEAQPVRQHQPVKPDLRTQSVGTHVESQIDTSGIARHADELGSLKAKMTDDVDEVKEKFDRDAKKFVSRHSTRDNTDSDIVGGNVSHIATDLIDMLRDPHSIRQAILVSEILRRPDFDD